MVQSVQYVKICSLYGVGFYYVPGTDMCIKIGGWVRAEYAYGDNGNFAWGWANGNVNNRNTNNSTWRARGYITADARNQTEYGTVRGYLAVGLSTNMRNALGHVLTSCHDHHAGNTRIRETRYATARSKIIDCTMIPCALHAAPGPPGIEG